jgi:MFS family permease
MPSTVTPRSLRALDWTNVFLADVRDGVGPYLAIYLLATAHWDAQSIGIALSASSFAAVVAQTPAGALVDALRSKRAFIVAAAIGIAVASLAMVWNSSFPTVIAAQIVTGISSTVFQPALAAITLGLVGRNRMDARLGRNEAFNHGGNVLAAALAGLLAWAVGREAIFYLLAAMSVGSILSVLAVRSEEIDPARARGSDRDSSDPQPTAPGHLESLGAMFADRRMLIFSTSVILFHFANAAMLPLVGQKLAAGVTKGASVYMSICIIAAQLIMIPVALFAGRYATKWGRKPVFLIGFAVLPVRGFLYTLSDNGYYLVAVQMLDGIGAGIFGVVAVIVIADLTRGTGRFNLTQGAIFTALGIGASLSVLLAGFIVQHAGYNAAFLALAAIAAVALALFAFAMPETRQAEKVAR